MRYEIVSVTPGNTDDAVLVRVHVWALESDRARKKAPDFIHEHVAHGMVEPKLRPKRDVFDRYIPIDTPENRTAANGELAPIVPYHLNEDGQWVTFIPPADQIQWELDPDYSFEDDLIKRVTAGARQALASGHGPMDVHLPGQIVPSNKGGHVARRMRAQSVKGRIGDL